MHANALLSQTALTKKSALRAVLKYEGSARSLKRLLKLGKDYRLHQILFWIELWKLCEHPPWRTETLSMPDGTDVDSETDFLHWIAAYVGESKSSLDNQLRRIRHARQNNVSWVNLVRALAVCPTAIDETFDGDGVPRTRTLPRGGVDELFFQMASSGNPSQAKALLVDYGARPGVTVQSARIVDGQWVFHFAVFREKDVTEHEYVFSPRSELDGSVLVEEWVRGRLK